jgi:ketosteroid isomerase-like protein
MKKMFLLFGTAALLASCGQDQTDKATVVAAAATTSVDAARPAIEAVDAAFMKAFPGGDSATVAGLYCSDAKIFPPNMPTTDPKGMGGISKFFATMKPSGFELKNNEMVAIGDQIMTSGTWIMSVGGKQADNGKFLAIWKQEGGQWKMYRDTWSSDNAPAPAPAK